VTFSRNHAVALVIIAVIGIGVWIAIRYVEGVFKERERQEELISEGNVEELAGKPPPPKPPAQPPLDRPTTRGTEVIVVVGPPPKNEPATRPSGPRKAVVVRGNGEFVRLPANAAEPGPVVTGILDRAAVDDLARFVTGQMPEADRGDTYATLVFLSAGQKSGGGLNRAGARRFLELTGKSINRSAAPESIQLKVGPADGDATEPWPFPRATPEGFAQMKRLSPDSDRSRYREAVLRLLDPAARFSHAGKVWKVEDLDLIP
jgi:hypothetical protein